MILSARDLKDRGVLCALRFVRVVDFSMSPGRRGECGMPTAPGLPLSVTLTGVCDGVELASPSIKRNLNNNMIIRSNLWRPPTGYTILTVYHELAYVLTAKYEEDVPLTF